MKSEAQTAKDLATTTAQQAIDVANTAMKTAADLAAKTAETTTRIETNMDILFSNFPVVKVFVKFVQFNVFSVVRKQLQVFYSIIRLNSVNVMNDFFFSKKPSHFFLHYKSMFLNK